LRSSSKSRLKNGEIYVVDSEKKQIIIFDNSGKPLRTIGKEGVNFGGDRFAFPLQRAPECFEIKPKNQYSTAGAAFPLDDLPGKLVIKSKRMDVSDGQKKLSFLPPGRTATSSPSYSY